MNESKDKFFMCLLFSNVMKFELSKFPNTNCSLILKFKVFIFIKLTLNIKMSNFYFEILVTLEKRRSPKRNDALKKSND